jgi:hypothetical protein
VRVRARPRICVKQNRRTRSGTSIATDRNFDATIVVAVNRNFSRA